ncbi:DNA-processing protein DprA [Bacillaceae bacterium W0354]
MQFKAMNRKKLQNYLKIDEELIYIKDLDPEALQKAFHLTSQLATNFYNYIHNDVFRSNYFTLFNKLTPLTIFDSHFPEELRQIPDPPLILYWKGNLNLLNSNKVAVIGSRKPSKFASQKIKTLITPLIENNITIVSGLAYGIDAMSHQITLDYGGNTIAILGFGYNHIYPFENISLYQLIAENGLILSEYPPDSRPKKWYFPERNRLISGLSKAILIIEATEKSGTMITADQALEQGKEVFAVPDSIFLKEAKGCLKLIQEGATPVINPNEFLEEIINNFQYKLT